MSIDKKYLEKKYSVNENEKESLEKKPEELDRLNNKISNANIQIANENAQNIFSRAINKYEAIKNYSESIDVWRPGDFSAQIKNLEVLENNIRSIDTNHIENRLKDEINLLEQNIKDLKRKIMEKLTMITAAKDKTGQVIPMQKTSKNKSENKPKGETTRKSFFKKILGKFGWNKDRDIDKAA